MTTDSLARRTRSFEDNRLVPVLFGPHNSHLARIEAQLGVRLAAVGNEVTATGSDVATDQAITALDRLWAHVRTVGDVGPADVDAEIRFAQHPAAPAGSVDDLQEPALPGFAPPGWRDRSIPTPKRAIRPRTPNQGRYIDALARTDMVFGLGPAGTGKTYLAVAQAVAMFTAGRVDRIILSRPAVEAGERLGFLPGDMKEKVDPYLRPLYDALYDMMPGERVAKLIETGVIEIAPLAFMRGRTLAHAYAILDEAQNTTEMQMKMFLTRMGEGSRMAITGDPSQVDLPRGTRSGLVQAIGLLEGVDGVTMTRFAEIDVVRHPLVARIVRAYEGT